MKNQENKLHSFIVGLKSSNIASNITSLNVYSELIKIQLEHIINMENISPVLKENLNIALSTIMKTFDDQINSEVLINLYIKFGDIFKSSLSDLKEISDNKSIKEIAINYLTISKNTKDTRIQNIAISIAEELKKNK